MRRVAVLLLVGFLSCAALAVGPGGPTPKKPGEQPRTPPEPPAFTKEDEALLTKLGLPLDGKGLLQYFQERTFKEANPDEMAQLIEQLGNDDFPTREKAYTRLQGLGSAALFTLKKAKDSPDTETKQRIHQLLQRIEENANPAVQSAVARMIAHRKPAGAVPVLLAYLPFAADETVVEQIRVSLTRLAVDNGKSAPALVAALKDKLPLKRRVAGEALARAGSDDQLPTIRLLLKDADPLVRLQVALALAERKEAKAVPVLIELMTELSPEQLWPAENLLVRLAGEKTPEASLGADEASRKKARDIWMAWWEKQDQKQIADRLAKLNDLGEYRGLTLVVYQGPNRVVNGLFRQARDVVELDPTKNKERWTFSIDNTNPIDAQVIGPNKLMLVEYQGKRISLRDFEGRILDKGELYLPGFPMGADLMPGGNFFVVMREQLAEYDRNWTRVWHYSRAQGDISRATKLRNGTVVFINNVGLVTFLNPKTQTVISTFNTGHIGSYYGGLDAQPNGNVLIPLYNNQQVVEYTPTGKAVNRINVAWPTSAVRLPNGDMLVGSINTRRLVQVNRQGKEVWSRQFAGQIYRVRAY